jgi:myo-inositol 2-dehydrogenase / D-chiro-inositol 1-dehydrogenase
MPTLVVGMLRSREERYMPTASVGMAPAATRGATAGRGFVHSCLTENHMRTHAKRPVSSVTATRRGFLQAAAGAAAATTLAAAVPHVHAGENNTLKIALVGCGGRGTGAAANALSTSGGPVQLTALADVFPQRIETSRKNLEKLFADKLDVPPDRQFVGFDAYRKAIDAVAPGGVVLLATPPAFRPIHLEYAVEKGCHAFMEKSFAVDAPGIRRVLKAGEAAAKKNLKIAGGLMSRHYPPLIEAAERIHAGAIGKVITAWAYREFDLVGFTPKSPGMSELAHQIRNYSNFTWLNGSFLLDWLIHQIDVSCWVKNAWPVSAQGQGGRQVRTEPDQVFDHYAVEYTFPDGTRLMAQGRSIPGCWIIQGCNIHGTQGSAFLGEGVPEPRLYKGHDQTAKNVIWRRKGQFYAGTTNPYQCEHDLLFDAIRRDKPYNETERCAKAAMTGILGRMAAESGQKIMWDEALNSQLELAPGLEQIASLDAAAPVMPDANGRYSIAMPGITKVL